VDPVIALWVPFVLFAALSWWMYRTLAHVPGGQPIGALERVAAKSGATLRRWLRFGRRRRVPA
jgi:lipopolysaccharide export system permease protein